MRFNPSSTRSAPLVIAAVTVLCLVAIGCGRGSDGKKPDDTSEPGIGSVDLTANASIKGALEADEGYTITQRSGGAWSDCAGLANSKSDEKRIESFVIPMPNMVGGQRVSWLARIDSYGGPSTYNAKRISLEARLENDKGKITRRFTASDATTAQATVEDDGSGTFEFKKLASGNDVLSGQVRWTCK